MSDRRFDDVRFDGPGFEGHVPDGDLLAYLDGEMSAKQAAACRAHLQHCWHCQTRAAALQKNIQSFVHFIYDDYSAQLPEPPNQWRGFNRKLQQLQSALPAVAPAKSTAWRPPWRQMIAGSGAVAAAMALFLLFAGRPQKLSATELLRRVMRAEIGRQVGKPRPSVQIRWGGKVFRVSAPLLPKPVAAVLQNNHFDFEDMLSASSFAAWRDSLKSKEDTIAESAGLLTLSIRPQPEANDLRINDWQIVEASLIVRRQDFYPVKEVFFIRSPQGSQTFEFSEADESVSTSVPEMAVAASHPKIAAPERAPLVKASPALELQILAKIHSIGADLGQEAALSRTADNGLAVNSVVEHVERKQQLLATLAPFQQNASIHFNILTAAEAAKQSRPAVAHATRNLLVNGNQSGRLIPASDALLAYFNAQGVSGPALTNKIQSFSEEVVLHSNAALLHSLALQDFAARFSPDQFHLFSPQERGQWRQVICDHAEAIADNTAALRAQLAPVYGKAAGFGEGATTTPKPSGLRSAAMGLLALVKSQDEIVHAAFTLSNEEDKAAAINDPAFWRFLAKVQDDARQLKELSKDPFEP